MKKYIKIALILLLYVTNHQSTQGQALEKGNVLFNTHIGLLDYGYGSSTDILGGVYTPQVPLIDAQIEYLAIDKVSFSLGFAYQKSEYVQASYSGILADLNHSTGVTYFYTFFSGNYYLVISDKFSIGFGPDVIRSSVKTEVPGALISEASGLTAGFHANSKLFLSKGFALSLEAGTSLSLFKAGLSFKL